MDIKVTIPHKLIFGLSMMLGVITISELDSTPNPYSKWFLLIIHSISLICLFVICWIAHNSVGRRFIGMTRGLLITGCFVSYGVGAGITYFVQ